MVCFDVHPSSLAFMDADQLRSPSVRGTLFNDGAAERHLGSHNVFVRRPRPRVARRWPAAHEVGLPTVHPRQP